MAWRRGYVRSALKWAWLRLLHPVKPPSKISRSATDDEDLDDLDEPIMEGSDDEFSDLDVEDIDDDNEMDNVTTGSDTLTGSLSHTILDAQGLLVQFLKV